MAISWAGIWDGNGFLIRLNAVYVVFPGLSPSSTSAQQKATRVEGGRSMLLEAILEAVASIWGWAVGIPQRWGQLSPVHSDLNPMSSLSGSRSGVVEQILILITASLLPRSQFFYCCCSVVTIRASLQHRLHFSWLSSCSRVASRCSTALPSMVVCLAL